MSLGSRYVRSIRWNVAAGGIQTLILLVRSVVLARLLPPEIFGTYALAVAVVAIPALISEFGLAEAFLHRAPETEDEAQAAAGHFTLRLLFSTVILGVFLFVVSIVTTGDLRLAFIGVTGGYYLLSLGSTATLILTRRVVHRRLALRQLTSSILTTLAAIYLAWHGWGILALLVTDLINGLSYIIFLMGWRPVWRPRLIWVGSTIQYYWNFGKRTVLGGVLLRAMDEIDDLWTGFFLGTNALGLYSRAYQFATYPRQLLAIPLNSVADGTYAALKGDRTRLSKAFFRTNALIVRSSFPLAGLLALTATEIIPVLLGPQWVPMIPTFRLMLLFTMLDPIRSTIASVFIAVGQPEIIVKARGIQLITLILCLFTFGFVWDIEGVGIAVNLMLFAGIVMLLWQARREVDFSVLKLFGVPSLALVGGLLIAYYGTPWQNQPSWWMAVGTKGIAFVLVFAGIMLLLEHRELLAMARTFRRYS